MPLNESYPYSPRLHEEILREQFLFEGFWSELLQKGKDRLLDAKEGIKKFGKEAWDILTAFYEVVKGGAGEISSFTGAIAKKGINKLLAKIRDTLKWMVAKLPEWDMPTFSDWAQKGLDVLDAIQENVNGLDGWKRVIGFAGLAVGLQWLWDKVGGWIDDLKEKVGDFGQALADDVIGPIKAWLKDTAMEKLKEVGGNAFKKVMTTLASISSGVKPWWDAAVKVAGGAKLVIDALGAAAAKFMLRQTSTLTSTTSEGNTSKGKMMRITKRQLNKIIRETIEAENPRHRGGSHDRAIAGFDPPDDLLLSADEECACEGNCGCSQSGSNDMATTALRDINSLASKIHSQVDAHDDLPDWVDFKLASVLTHLRDISLYLSGNNQ